MAVIQSELACELFAILNPINHGSGSAEIERYKVEPYAMCADIYGAPPHTGRGGWTWYTGAAGWMYRLTVETLLGLQLEVDQLRITPCIPAHWESYKVHYRYRETVYHITVKNMVEKPEHESRVTLDGVALKVIGVDVTDVNSTVVNGMRRPQGIIPLVDDRREHYVEMVTIQHTQTNGVKSDLPRDRYYQAT